MYINTLTFVYVSIDLYMYTRTYQMCLALAVQTCRANKGTVAFFDTGTSFSVERTKVLTSQAPSCVVRPSFALQTQTHTHTHTQTCRHNRSHRLSPSHKCTHARTYVRTHTRTQTSTHAHEHTPPHACMHARTHAQMHAHTHSHTHLHTHARMHTHTRSRMQRNIYRYRDVNRYIYVY